MTTFPIRILWLLGRMGPQERAAQQRLNEAVGMVLTLEEGERMSDEVWEARWRDRQDQLRGRR